MARTALQLRALVVAEARAMLGHDYRDSSVPRHWPPAQFDCSTFTHWCWSKAGLDIDQGRRDTGWPQKRPVFWRKYPGYTMDQVRALKAAGCSIDFDDAQPGDLSFYSGGTAGVGSSGHHVVMHIGEHRIIHAAGTAWGVIESRAIPPGEVGHGGKIHIGTYSPIVLAENLGLIEPPATHVVRVGGASSIAVEEAIRQSGMSDDYFLRRNGRWAVPGSKPLQPRTDVKIRPTTPLVVPLKVTRIQAGRDRA